MRKEAFVLIALLGGCATTIPQIHQTTTTTPAAPTMSCQITLPVASSLPTSPHDAFNSVRSDSASDGMYHDGVDLTSSTPEVRAVRGGKRDFYVTEAGKGQHLSCLSIIVNEEWGISDIYCGFETRTDMKMLQVVKPGDLLGMAREVGGGRYSIHYGIHAFHERVDGAGNVDRFLNPEDTLRQMNNCQ